ncbi:S9 family peptidase [Salinimicrobium flavum]|uniref:Prolyl oligopeptidase family serine peptidase n=1 Tax=Salinimicrobium flavum TaxID=1737065 RepID=A0ABW5IXV7_9FLAO
MNKTLFFFVVACLGLYPAFAQQSDLSVEKIMQDPQWMGSFPSNISWGAHSENIYFNYNPERNPADSLYRINIKDQEKIVPVSWKDREKLPPASGDFNDKKTKKVFTRSGSLLIYDLKSRKEKTILDLGAQIREPKFLANEDLISFVFSDNAYIYDLRNGTLKKLTNIRRGNEKEDKDKDLSEQDEWLKTENLELLQVVQERETKKEETEKYRELTQAPEPFTFYTGKKQLSNLAVAPNGRYVTFNLITRAENPDTNVPNYVDPTGYTVNLPARSKVGSEPTKMELAIYNLKKDTVYLVQTNALPGIKDLPNYIKDYPDREWKEEEREVIVTGPVFSDNGERAVVNVRSHDNKDRWIAQLDLGTGELTSLDRQRDEAWIAGPGIGYSFSKGTLGWLPDNKSIYYQSEETGYSHLYLLNTETGKKQALTSGEFEIFDPFLSNNKKHWYFTSSEVDPGERHFYRMPVNGGQKEKLTNMTGNNEVELSPDEKYMAIRHSYSNKPWELYLKRTSKQAEAKQLTAGATEDFRAYDWRDPQLVSFTGKDGAEVPARLYTPETSNGAAVIFVHGAGYLQNVHKWWSSYFREYMFHNLLTDLGYTVLDIDYRGSAGYGRDWRTGIYRHMGGKDLADQVSGAEFLVKDHGVDAEKIGIYGGSYGGFITLMAMFTEADTFKSGAALRSVTDWAHYNHGYTSNILNEPVSDPIAYRRSSPIYFAEGLEGNLLIAHGMTDVNVHYQDVVRLAQRLIELGKEDWEMAVYPVEGHGFVEPSSWTDEYRRILELFNETLLD